MIALLKKKKWVTTSIVIEQNQMDKITEAAELFDVPKIKIIRECFRAELPRMIDRERKRQRRTDKSQDR